MSYDYQGHHPHQSGGPPNAALIGQGAEGRPYIPAALSLVQAHWFVRHGERAPVRQRLAGFGDIPSVFSLCSASRAFSPAILRLSNPAKPLLEASSASPEGEIGGPTKLETGTIDVRRISETQGEGNVATRGGLADCYWGELTDLGRQSTLALGAKLRTLYVDDLGFLPPVLADQPPETAAVSFRSSGLPRTIESLHQVVEGLFPQREGPVNFTVRQPADESLYPNGLCGRMKKLDMASAAKAAEKYNPTLAVLDEKLGKFTNGVPLRIDSRPRANGIIDTIYVARAHGIAVPPEFTDVETLRTIETAVVHEWFDAYSNLEFRKLSMGRLLGDLGAALQQKVADPQERTDKLRLAINACHDTTLGGILKALDAFDGRWPPFTSHLAFELFRSDAAPRKTFLPAFLTSAPKVQHYVRARYNGRDVKLPACAKEGKHLEGSEEVCTLEAFLEAVDGVKMTGREWTEQCKT